MSAVCVLALNLALNNNNITIKQLEHDFSCRVMKATRRKVSHSTEGSVGSVGGGERGLLAQSTLSRLAFFFFVACHFLALLQCFVNLRLAWHTCRMHNVTTEQT